MFETIAGGVAVAAISGITYYAFKEPDGFGSLFNLLVGAAMLVATGVITWTAALKSAYKELVPVLNEEQTAAALEIFVGLSVPGWWLGAWISLLAYLFFLAFFPMHVQLKSRK